MNDNIVELQK